MCYGLSDGSLALCNDLSLQGRVRVVTRNCSSSFKGQKLKMKKGSLDFAQKSTDLIEGYMEKSDSTASISEGTSKMGQLESPGIERGQE